MCYISDYSKMLALQKGEVQQIFLSLLRKYLQMCAFKMLVLSAG